MINWYNVTIVYFLYVAFVQIPLKIQEIFLKVLDLMGD